MRPTARLAAGLLALPLAAAASCSRSEPTRGTGAPTAPPAAPRDAGTRHARRARASARREFGTSAEPIPAEPSPWRETSRLPRRARRSASGAEATVDAGERSLTTGDPLPESSIVSLARDARLTVKNARTGRETTLEGPALGRLCVDSENEAWLAAGVLRAAPGAGESLGSEVFVATPYAAIRYTAASLRASIGDALELEVNGGGALVRPASGARLRPRPGAPADAGATEGGGWLRVPGGTSLAIEPNPGAGNPLTKELAACKAAADETRLRVRQLNAFDSGDLPEHAVAHLEARQRAHAACAIAHATLLKIDPAGGRRTGVEELSKADALWTSIGEPLTDGH